MKTSNNIPPGGRFRPWLVIIGLLALSLLTSCGGSSSSLPNSSPSFEATTDLEGKVFVLGAQEDVFGNLVLYVIGTDPDGSVLTVAELQTASVTVGGVSYNTSDDPAKLEILAVGAGDKILSLATLTDYSTSTKAEVQVVEDVLTEMLDSLPLVYEAQIMTFSNELETHLAWSEDLTEIRLAVREDHPDRDQTALYDSMGIALEGDLATEGLVDRCRPAHMLVMFTDGNDNFSSVYTSATDLGAIVNDDKTIVIIMSTRNAKMDILTKLAGDSGVVVRAADPDSLVAAVEKWASSLDSMVKITLDSSVDITGKTVNLSIGSQTVEVDPNSHCTLPP